MKNKTVFPVRQASCDVVLRYTEAVELADVMVYDIVWQKRRGGR